MLFREYSRPFDPTANSPLNLIIGEKRNLAEDAERVFIPSHGPYYTSSLLVTNGGTPLVRGIDYECVLFHREASVKTAKEVGVAIKIIRTGLVEINIDYQAVGGEFQDLTGVIRELMDNLGHELVNPIPWKNVVDKPDKFPPAAHNHPYWEFTGWDALLTPIDQIRQGVLLQDRIKYREVYDYFYLKKTQLDNQTEQKLKTLSTSIKNAYLKIRDPLNRLLVRMDAQNPATIRDGAWVEIADRVLAFTNINSKIGTEVPLSEEIVYPQPDNILLDESDVPIMRDDDEWIYLDNEHPVFPGVVEDYDEEIDEQFDLYYVKGFRKLSHGVGYSASLSMATTTPIREGILNTVNIVTYKYAPGIKVPYAIEGVGDANITIPKYGTVTLDNTGRANLNFTLISNSPATGMNQLTIELALPEAAPLVVPYVLSTNSTYTASMKVSHGIMGAITEKYIVGEDVIVAIEHVGLKGKTVRLAASFDGAGGHTCNLRKISSTTGSTGYIDVLMSEGTEYIVLTGVQASNTQTTRLNINLSLNSTNISTKAIPAELFTFTPKYIISDTRETVTTIADDIPFSVWIDHNSDRHTSFPVVVTENTFGAELSVTPPSLIQSTSAKTAESHQMMSNRVNTLTPDRLTLRIQSPYYSGNTKTITITVPAVV